MAATVDEHEQRSRGHDPPEKLAVTGTHVRQQTKGFERHERCADGDGDGKLPQPFPVMGPLGRLAAGLVFRAAQLGRVVAGCLNRGDQGLRIDCASDAGGMLGKVDARLADAGSVL